MNRVLSDLFCCTEMKCFQKRMITCHFGRLLQDYQLFWHCGFQVFRISRLTVDQQTQVYQSKRVFAFHCRTYMEMYSCSVCMSPQTIFMWEMSFCLASKISSRSTCLSGKVWVSHHNLLACKTVAPHWCCCFVPIQHTATILHGTLAIRQAFCLHLHLCRSLHFEAWLCCLNVSAWIVEMWLTWAHGWAAEIVVSVGMALPQNLMSIQRWEPAQ